MTRVSRLWLSWISGLAGLVGWYLVFFPTGCDDVGGVPSWERCSSPLGWPAFSVEDLGLDATLDIVQPLVAAILIGVITWLLTGLFEAHDAPSMTDD